MPTSFRQLLFVHVPKTGGSWVVQTMRQLGRPTQEGYSHTPVYWLHAEQRVGRRVVAVLREPDQWYESWYHHCLGSGQRGRIALRAFGRGSLDFPDVVAGAISLAELGELPRDFGGVVVFRGEEDRRPSLRSHTGGLWSWWYKHLLGWPPQVDVLLDHSRLRAEFGQLLGCELPAADYPAANTKARHGNAEMSIGWTKESRRAICRVEGPYLDRLKALLWSATR